MVLKIDDIIYDCVSYEKIGLEHEPRWISLRDYKLWKNHDLISLFGFKDQADIIQSGEFVQLFCVDIIELEHKYMECFSYNEQRSVQLFAKETNYDKSFLCFIDHKNQFSQWYEFERIHLINAAIEWCKHNHIRYKI